MSSRAVAEALRDAHPDLARSNALRHRRKPNSEGGLSDQAASEEAYSKKVERALKWGVTFFNDTATTEKPIEYQIQRMPKADRELTYDELVALVVAEVQLELLGGTRVGASFCDLVKWIQMSLSTQPKKKMEEIREFIRVRGRPSLKQSAAYQPGNLALILKACTEMGWLSVSYKSGRGGPDIEAKERVLRAHYLTLSEDGLYLTAMERSEKGEPQVVNLALARIKSIERVNEIKISGKGLDKSPDRQLEQIFGIQLPDDFNEPVQEFTLKFHPELAPFICERNWPGQQGEPTRNRDGTATIQFKLRLTKDLVRWVLGWGSRVTVVQGKSLKNRLVREAQAIMGLYKES